MSEIYNNEIQSESEEKNRGSAEKMVGIYQNTVCFRKDPDHRTNTHQHLPDTGSVCVRCYRAATVSLALLCFLLLIAMATQIILSSEEKKQLLTNISTITDQKNQLLTNISTLTEQKNHLLTNINNLNHLNKELYQEKNNTLKMLNDEWIYYNYSFYFMSTEKRNWDESRKHCRDRHADLIIINSEDEQKFVGESRREHWIGLSDRDNDGIWKWVDDTKLISPIWYYREPSKDKDCVMTWSTGWDAKSCDDSLQWICEKNVKRF